MKWFLAAPLLLSAGLSMAAQAGVIAHYGFERDSTATVVKGGGLEWLKWDQTKGKTVSQAVSDHSGWRLATATEMTALFNTFQFGIGKWQPDQLNLVSNPWTADEQASHNAFLQLFGSTFVSREVCVNSSSRSCYLPQDNMIFSRAWFASAVPGKVGSATVRDDYTSVAVFGSQIKYSYQIALEFERAEVVGTGDWGVALVRSTAGGPVAVNSPASIGLLAIGLLGLSLRRRYRLRRA